MQGVAAGLQCLDVPIMTAQKSHAHKAVQCNATHNLSRGRRHLVGRTRGDAHTAAVDERLGRSGLLGMVQRQESAIHVQALAQAPPS